MTVLFHTVHGSRLYGLAHENSDHDSYTVVTDQVGVRRNVKQRLTGDRDQVTVPLSHFMLLCEKGVPQALEAMFAGPEFATGPDLLADMRRGYRVTEAVVPTYLRTIESFALAGTAKKKRHALRLAVCVNQIRHLGRFNPTLDPGAAESLTNMVGPGYHGSLDGPATLRLANLFADMPELLIGKN